MFDVSMFDDYELGQLQGVLEQLTNWPEWMDRLHLAILIELEKRESETDGLQD